MFIGKLVVAHLTDEKTKVQRNVGVQNQIFSLSFCDITPPQTKLQDLSEVIQLAGVNAGIRTQISSAPFLHACQFYPMPQLSSLPSSLCRHRTFPLSSP